MVRTLLLVALAAPPLMALATPPCVAAETGTKETLPPGAQIASLTATPSALQFKSQHAYAQLVVTAQLESGEAVDVTRLAAWTVPEFVTLAPTGLVRPIKNGTGRLRMALGGKTLEIPTTVELPQTETPTSFIKDVQPVLSKLGCNSGTCHGSAQGKNGFKLSLRGYDPIFDHRALTDDLEGRRFNRAAPDKSLMLMKPVGSVPHAGGMVMQLDDPNYKLVKKWIAEGVRQDLTAPRVKSIEVYPSSVTIGALGTKQQFRVQALYTDGSSRDVTAEAFLESSNTEVAIVDRSSLLTSVRRGEATMLARYEGAYAAANVVVMGDRTGFEWVQRPVHNYIDELVDAKLKK